MYWLGFLGLAVQEYLGYPRLGTIIIEQGSPNFLQWGPHWIFSKFLRAEGTGMCAHACVCTRLPPDRPHTPTCPPTHACINIFKYSIYVKYFPQNILLNQLSLKMCIFICCGRGLSRDLCCGIQITQKLVDSVIILRWRNQSVWEFKLLKNL